MRYWVDENWVNDKAFVHAADCSDCNDGKGKNNVSESNDGTWHGHYDTFDEALQFAKGTGQSNTRAGVSGAPIVQLKGARP